MILGDFNNQLEGESENNPKCRGVDLILDFGTKLSFGCLIVSQDIKEKLQLLYFLPD